jgi:transglutaminase-like putative cysteine protease
MRIRIGYELIFTLPAPTAMLVMLSVRPERTGDLEKPEYLQVEPAVPVNLFIDSFGNRCGRFVAPAGRVRFSYDNICRDSGVQEDHGFGAIQHNINQLPPEVLPFLLSSRYCEVDRMVNLAWQMFGQIPEGWQRVQAVCNWVHQNIEFGYAYARPTKTAWDVYMERKGVCRDFMHLSITFLRAMNIPCRYATGYLGDIGVPAVPLPMDFSAWFEVYLGNRWWTLDARHNTPRIGRILMGQGRDAVDVALTTSFGPHTLESFKVVTEEVRP